MVREKARVDSFRTNYTIKEIKCKNCYCTRRAPHADVSGVTHLKKAEEYGHAVILITVFVVE